MDVVDKRVRDAMMNSIRHTIDTHIEALERRGVTRKDIVTSVKKMEHFISSEVEKLSEEDDDRFNLSALFGMMIFYTHMKYQDLNIAMASKEAGVSPEMYEREMMLAQDKEEKESKNVQGKN